MISRRKLISAAALSLASTRGAFAGLGCKDSDGTRTCTVRLPVKLKTAIQQCDTWCWAACIQTIFDYYGHQVQQADIVQKVFKQQVKQQECKQQGTYGPQIVDAIANDWRDAAGHHFQAAAQPLWDSYFGVGGWPYDALRIAAEELQANSPLIVGTQRMGAGHTTVMSAMTYSSDPYHGLRIQQIEVSDPWEHLGRRVLQRDEAIAFLVRVRVADRFQS